MTLAERLRTRCSQHHDDPGAESRNALMLEAATALEGLEALANDLVFDPDIQGLIRNILEAKP